MLPRKLNKMSVKIVTGIALALYAVNASARLIRDPEYKCTVDLGPKESLEKLQQRLNWAWKCYPDAMEYFGFRKDAAENLWYFADGKRMVYPVFGLMVKIDENSIVLEAPVDGSAACDALSEAAANQKVRIVGFCGF